MRWMERIQGAEAERMEREIICVVNLRDNLHRDLILDDQQSKIAKENDRIGD